MSDVSEDSELMDIFFNDSPKAKLMVNATSLRIIKVNDALLRLLNIKQENIVGKLWKDLDHVSNHDKYEQYIKELNSKDSMSFIIKHNQQGQEIDYEVNYQISALNETIGYLGSIKPITYQDIPDKLFAQIRTILKANFDDENEGIIFDNTKALLDLSFLAHYKYKNSKLEMQNVYGDENRLRACVSKYHTTILKRVTSKLLFEISKNSYETSQNLDLLHENELESFFAYPISFQNSIYGCIIAGGKQKPENWNIIRTVLNILTQQYSFSLFDKSIVKQKKFEGEYDKLTGLLNRKSMDLKLAEIVKQGIDEDKYISLFLINIDSLKSINEKFGIKFTDELIKTFSSLLLKTVRRTGQVYRLTGESFAILLNPRIHKESITELADKLVDRLSVPTLLSNGEEVRQNFNMGVSIYPDAGQTVGTMIKNAELALHDAKKTGKNSYLVFKHSETGIELKKRTELEENLKAAISDGRIQAFFQPKINTVTEEIVGFEALVRWVEPGKGVILPGYFIPMAEETGLIHELGKTVAIQSCQKIREWQDKYNLTLTCSINLSPTQLVNPKLPEILESIINAAGIHPQFIDFEITESIGLDSVPNLVDTLNKIVEIGCTLSIDDFGTGHSSLDYVKKIPAKYIKIDQSFVSNIGLNPEDEAILDATIDMAKRMQREIIAEGVESEQQREYLLERDCEYLQGYLFSKPLPAKKIESILAERVRLMSISN
jgi:diguanylate cyclase (GGDEF)-like protein